VGLIALFQHELLPLLPYCLLITVAQGSAKHALLASQRLCLVLRTIYREWGRQGLCALCSIKAISLYSLWVTATTAMEAHI